MKLAMDANLCHLVFTDTTQTLVICSTLVSEDSQKRLSELDFWQDMC